MWSKRGGDGIEDPVGLTEVWELISRIGGEQVKIGFGGCMLAKLIILLPTACWNRNVKSFRIHSRRFREVFHCPLPDVLCPF